jgi:hypothetical protein
MDLNDEAQAALDALLEEQNIVLPYNTQAIARLMWLEGHKAGADAVRQFVRDGLSPLVSK